MENKNMEAEMNKNGIAALVTPRRSARKSIKPLQDYQDIVSGTRHVRSTSKALFSHEGNTEALMDETRTKWTPAKVGRSSEKRGRKSRRTVGNKNKRAIISSRENEDAEGSENKKRRTNIAVLVDPEAKENEFCEAEAQEPDEKEIPGERNKTGAHDKDQKNDANVAEYDEEEESDMEPLHVYSDEWDEEEDFDMEPLHVYSDEWDED